MQLKVESCNKCKNDKPIVNRKHALCQECNWERLHPVEGSYAENQAKKQSLSMSRLRIKAPHLKRSRPRQTSSRQREANVRIADVYKEMAQSRDRVCTGCGTTERLSHSHIIPRSRRKDLEADAMNITYQCLSFGEVVGCHDIWEHGSLDQKQQLHDFEVNMKYIKEIDLEYYELLLS